MMLAHQNQIVSVDYATGSTEALSVTPPWSSVVMKSVLDSTSMGHAPLPGQGPPDQLLPSPRPERLEHDADEHSDDRAEACNGQRRGRKPAKFKTNE